MLHRASMKFYENWLQQQEYAVSYIETTVEENYCRDLVASLAKQKITLIHIAAWADDWLLKRMQLACKKNKITLYIYDSPNFLNTPQSVEDYFSKKRTYFQTDIYICQRKQRNILLEKDGIPLSGEWIFDAENRQKLPKNEKVPALELPKENKYVNEAKRSIRQHFFIKGFIWQIMDCREFIRIVYKWEGSKNPMSAGVII